MKKLFVVLVMMAMVTLTACGSNRKEVIINVDEYSVSEAISMANEIKFNSLYEYEITLTSYSVPVISKTVVSTEEEYLDVIKNFVMNK